MGRIAARSARKVRKKLSDRVLPEGFAFKPGRTHVGTQMAMSFDEMPTFAQKADVWVG